MQYPDLVILGTLNLPKAHHPDLLQFGSQKLGRVDQLPNVLLITFRPPNTKHLQLLSLQPIQLSEDGGVLQGEGNGTNKGMEEAMEQMLQLDFARSFASGQKGELPLRQVNDLLLPPGAYIDSLWVDERCIRSAVAHGRVATKWENAESIENWKWKDQD